jgi:hypothetical protein
MNFVGYDYKKEREPEWEEGSLMDVQFADLDMA